MTEELTGGCGCGEVRYALTSPPMFTNCCHCLDCQRQTGSAFVINGIIETDRIRLLAGQPEGVMLPTESGRTHMCFRCPSCQVALWSDYGGRSYLRFLRVGTLDNPALVQPDAHIFTRTKLPWITLPGDVPAFEVYYDMKATWSPEALARRQAASDAAKNSPSFDQFGAQR